MSARRLLLLAPVFLAGCDLLNFELPAFAPPPFSTFPAPLQRAIDDPLGTMVTPSPAILNAQGALDSLTTLDGCWISTIQLANRGSYLVHSYVIVDYPARTITEYAFQDIGGLFDVYSISHSTFEVVDDMTLAVTLDRTETWDPLSGRYELLADDNPTTFDTVVLLNGDQMLYALGQSLEEIPKNELHYYVSRRIDCD